MGFFNRKNKGKKLSKEALAVEWFEKELKALEKVDKVDQKIIQLEEIKIKIEKDILDKKMGILSSSNTKGSLAGITSDFTQISALVGTTIALGAVPIFGLAILPGMVFGSSYIKNKVSISSQKKLFQKNEALMRVYNEQLLIITELEDATLSKDLEGFTKSPVRDEIFETYPNIKARFAHAAAKSMESKREPSSIQDNTPDQQEIVNKAEIKKIKTPRNIFGKRKK